MMSRVLPGQVRLISGKAYEPKNYKVLYTEEKDISEFVKDVNQHIDNGWYVHGPHRTVTYPFENKIRTSQSLVYRRSYVTSYS
jgi:hypothetical protein